MIAGLRLLGDDLVGGGNDGVGGGGDGGVDSLDGSWNCCFRKRRRRSSSR